MVIELKKGKEWINRMIKKIFDGASIYSITRYIYFKKNFELIEDRKKNQ